MKNYKHKFSTITIILLILGVVIAVACTALNAVRFYNLVKNNMALTFYDYASLIIAVVLSIAFIVIAICALLNSYYKITDKGVTLNFGFIKTKIDASEVKEVKLEVIKNRLELTFNDESYFIILINEKDYESFIDEFRSKFTKIPYIQISEKSN